jgi:thioredoxin 1
MGNDNVKEFTDNNFDEEALSSDVPVIVDLWAPWCGPCRMLTPIIEELAEEYGDKIKVGKLNVDDNPQTAAKYGVTSIPTVFFIKDGEVKDKQVGLLPKGPLKAKIDALFES